MNVDNIIVKIIDKFTNTRVLVEEHTQVSAPKLIFNGSDDKYQSIMASEFHFNLLVRNNADGFFFHLYTGNERRYYVTVESQDDELLFEGWLLPDFYEEPYTNAVMFVNLVATDGLASLKNAYLEDSEYQKEINVIKLISLCLKKTGLQKNMLFANAIESAATDYKWHEIAVNCETYLDGEIKYIDGFFLDGNNVIFPKRKNCYEILDLLIASLGCTFYGYGENWFIEGINRKHEANQLVDVYSHDGLFSQQNQSIKEIVSVHNYFNLTPSVTVVSPWKRVNISWDIKEDGDLVPKWAVTDPRTLTLFEAPKKNPFDFWKTNGTVIQVQVAPKGYRGSYNFWENTSNFERPNVLRVAYGMVNPSNFNVIIGETLNTVNNRYLSIKNRKYLKVSDEYITRTLKIDIELQCIDAFPVSVANGTDAAIDSEDFFIDFFKTNIKIDDIITITSKANGDGPVELIKYEIGQMNIKVTPNGATALLKCDITAKLQFEEKSIPENGFFDLTLHAAVHPNASNQFFNGYNVNKITAFYTEEDTWTDTLERNIDFSTFYDLDIFHSDSIQDLSERQWRFRRYIPQQQISNQVNVSASGEEIISWGSGSSNFIYWKFVIDYASAQLIINNPTLFQWNLPNPLGVINITEMLGPIGNFTWNVQQDVTGVWVLSLLPNTYMLDLGLSYFQDKPLSINLDGEQPFYGWVTEDNEWRESWKRKGQNESIRYGVALAKIYHDVQSGPIIKIEGTALKLISPRELIHFKYMGDKHFIPTRLELDFSEGKTNLLMLESKYEIVTDYVN